MNSLIKGCLVLTVVLLGSLPVDAYCTEHWGSFLQQPDKDNFVELEKTLTKSLQRCEPAIAPGQKHRAQLFELISDGNPFAFHAGIIISRCWDGGDLEDFYRSAGIFFEIYPLAFMKIVKEMAIPDPQLKRLLTMLPLDTVDNIDLKISIVENRIDILNGIDEESFDEIKISGIFYLEKMKRSLVRIKNELEKAK